MQTIIGAGQDAVFAIKRFFLGPYRVRRTQVFGLGTGKNGTHSLAEMFSRNVRAQHEPQALEVIDRVLDRHEGRLKEADWIEWLRARERKLALEVDSSHLNCFFLDFLVKEYPNARFILPIRDCYSWVNSNINQFLRFRAELDPRWHRLGALLRGPNPQVYAPEESVLQQKDLASLDTYFTFWTTRNNDVLAQVPASRLLVVRTDQITEKAFEIADFAGLPRRTIRIRRARAYVNPDRQELLRQIDRAFLERKVDQHCRALMTRFFPEIKSLDDAKL